MSHRFLSLFALLFLCCCSLLAQNETAILNGTVRDPSGGAVPDALVKLSGDGIEKEMRTDEQGNFSLHLPPGRFKIQAGHTGFENTNKTLELGVNSVTSLDIPLLIASAISTVSVSATEGYIASESDGATKTEAPLLDTPQSVSVITREQLDQRDVQTLNESLRYTPGVAVETYGVDPRYDSFLIRGFGDSTNGFFIDGLRFPGYLGQTDPYMAQDITVLKGPSSVLYGQSAPGGLINVTTKRPPETPLREIQVDFGSYGRKQVEGDFGGRIDSEGKWRYRFTGLYRDSGTQVNYSPDDRWFAAPAITWAPSEKTSLTLLSFYERDHSGWAQFLPAEGTLYANPNGNIPASFFTGIPGFDGVHRNQWSLGYIFDHSFSPRWTFHQSFRSYNVFYNGATAYGVGLASDLATINRDAYTFRDTDTLYAVDTQVRSTFGTGAIQHSFLAGYDFSRTGDYPTGAFAAVPGISIVDPQYTGITVPTLTPYLDDRQWQRQSGVYLQDQMKVAEHWTVLLNGREDLVKDVTHNLFADSVTPSNYNHFSGRAGVSYSAPFGLAPYVSYSTSFLPTLGVNYYGQPYAPTTGRQFETGLKIQPSGWRTFVTASFYNVDENHVQTVDPDNPLNQVQVGQVRSRGAEVEAVSKLRGNFSLHAGYSYDDAKVTDTTDASQLGRYLVSVPRQTASAFLDYAVPKGFFSGLGLGFGTRYVGVQAGSADNTIQVPGYTLFDGWMSYNWKLARFSVNATNIGDKQYIGVCNSISYCNYGFARRVIGSVAFRW